MNYTSVDQSKKLMELGLNPETADMIYFYYQHYDHNLRTITESGIEKEPTVRCELPIEKCDIPCWSVGELIKLMPKIGVNTPILVKALMEEKYYCHYYGLGTSKEIHTTGFYDEPIDAAFEMVAWLLEHDYITKTN